MQNTPSSHDSYNIYTNRQVKMPFLLACDLKWRSLALHGSNEILQKTVGASQVKLHNPSGSGNVSSRIKSAICKVVYMKIYHQ